MLITRETDYAIRAIRALSQEEKCTVHEICEAESIPTAFGYRILKKLSRSNIVRIIRGSTGGYSLIADLNALTLMDIVLSIDPDFFLNECMQQGYVCTNNIPNGTCQIHMEIGRIQSALEAELRRNSIAQLLAAQMVCS